MHLSFCLASPWRLNVNVFSSKGWFAGADLILLNFPATANRPICTSKKQLLLSGVLQLLCLRLHISSSNWMCYLSFQDTCLKFRPRWKQLSTRLYLGGAVSSRKCTTQRRLLSVCATWEGSENIWMVDFTGRKRRILSFLSSKQQCLS